MIKKIVARIFEVCSVDIRSLALMRIATAIALLVDLIVRLVNLKAHYTDEGILPLEALFRYAWQQYHFSFYTMGHVWQWQLFLFLLNFICIIFLLIGYRTKLFTILCWLFIISIHNRNPLIHQGGDDLLRLILFWAIFLPWGYYYSVDAEIYPRQNLPYKYTSMAVLGYILQVMYVYIFSAFLKNAPEWNGEFTALYYALSFDQIVLGPGKWIYPHYDFLKLMTRSVYYIELVVPFFLLIPWFTNFFRVLFLVIMTLLHIGISISLNVGLFPLIAITSMVALIPGNYLKFINKIKFNVNWKNSLVVKILQLRSNGILYPKEHFIITNICLFFIFYTFSWNIGTLGKKPILSTGPLEWIGHFFRVDQHWGMFAPAVFKDDGWFIFEAEKVNSKKIDILNNDTLFNLQRPQEIPSLFKSDRWRKYSENFLFVVNGHYRLYFCFYILNNWNNQNPDSEKLRALKIHYVKEVSLPNYQTGSPLKEQLCTCELYPPKNVTDTVNIKK